MNSRISNFAQTLLFTLLLSLTLSESVTYANISSMEEAVNKA